MKKLLESELIINPDGSIYHLGIHPDAIQKNIITVGDLDRVNEVVKHFDRIVFTKQNREFKTVGGYIGKTFITVISTGIGVDNIDIVLNELFFLVNFDLTSRELKSTKRSLNIIRLGTSGSVHESIALDEVVYSKYAISGANMLGSYQHSFPEIEHGKQILPVVPCSALLESKFDGYKPSMTYTASGFYGPQFRRSGIPLTSTIEVLKDLSHAGLPVGNIEMETAGIYGLAHLMGFESISINAILANRKDGSFSRNPEKTISDMIANALEIIANGDL